ncbi:hypothetical protein MKEN_00185200 [Mycena kentingensis (nom. inval.)]|nr:hypothetical protein MKEN_00185200 [Mycena kentingensis (nom. inval.)]
MNHPHRLNPRQSYWRSTEEWSDSATEEAAAARLWSVYVDEAEKYDAALLESWNRDMEGILIFAGLFSASLTAFLIESYRTLLPDTGGATLVLLGQISLQLAAATNGSTCIPNPVPSPRIPASSIVCNVLWFLSLALSLLCALAATLIEQWTRDFLHRANMRSSPLIRARVYSYLYYGVQRFRMHTVVDMVPTLLHASLALFFCGLVAFLLPVNTIIAGLVAFILALVIALYAILTILPLLNTNCPYRTPLSNALWELSRDREHAHLHTSETEGRAPAAIVESLICRATIPSDNRAKRDMRSLVWTLASLSTNTEFERFIEAIPDALWSQHTRNPTYTKYIEQLRDNSKLHLCSRILELLQSSRNALLSPEACRQRQLSCFQAVWAIASIASPPAASQYQLPELVKLFAHLPSDWRSSDRDPYLISISTLCRWSGLQWLKTHLRSCAELVAQDRITAHSAHLQPVREFLRIIFYRDNSRLTSALINAAEFSKVTAEICSEISHSIYFNYLTQAGGLSSLPYRWTETLGIITPLDFAEFSTDRDLVAVELAVQQLGQTLLRRGTLNLTEQRGYMDPQLIPHLKRLTAFERLCLCWRPETPRLIPPGLLAYVTCAGEGDDAARTLFRNTHMDTFLWPSFHLTLLNADKYQRPHDEILSLIWLTARFGSCGPILPPAEFSALLASIRSCGSDKEPAAIAIIKSSVLNSIKGVSASQLQPIYLHYMDELAPSPSSHRNMDVPCDAALPLYHRACEAQIALLCDFLNRAAAHNWDADSSRTKQTIKYLCDVHPQGSVHEAHQSAFAGALSHLAEQLDQPVCRKILQMIVESDVFRPYLNATKWMGMQPSVWLKDEAARRLVRDALVTYRDKSDLGAEGDKLGHIIEALGSFHNKETGL